MSIKKSLSITLEILLGIGEFLYEASGYKFSRKSIYKIMNNTYPEWSDAKKSNWMCKLEINKYITRDTSSSSDSVILTNKGLIKILENTIVKNKSDGLIRLVSFDIPEEKRNQRNQFRRTIKRAGFVQIQKSLWATRKNAGDIVEIAAEEYKINDYVAYIVAKSTNIEDYIDKQLSKHKI